MSQKREISDAFEKLTGSFKKDFVTFSSCTVESVNEEERTCDVTVIEGEAELSIPDVYLMAEPNDGMFIVPVVGSTVLVGITKKNIPYVVMFSEIETVYMTAAKFQFNDGSFGGLIKIEELVSKLNAIEQKVNDVIEIFNTHTHTGGTIGGSTAVSANLITGVLTETDKSELENDLITHGE